MKSYVGYARISSGDPEEFYFEVEDGADEEQISNEMVDAMWESGVVDVWYEEIKE